MMHEFAVPRLQTPRSKCPWPDRGGSPWMLAATLIALALPGLPINVLVLSVTVGSVVITDNLAMDTNPSQGVIDFNSANPGPQGFVVPQGYVVSGTANLVPSGSLTGGGGSIDSVVNLTNFTARRPAGATGGPLLIKFANTFPVAPSLPAWAADAIKGSFSNPSGIGAGNSLSFQGYVNAAAINPPAGPFASAPGAGPTAFFYVGGHGPQSLAGGPPWTAEGQLSLTLGTTGDQLNLPNSAEVGINTVPIRPVPTVPAASGWSMGVLVVLLLTAGTLLVLGRRRAISTAVIV